MKRANAANKQVVTLEAELDSVHAAHTRFVDISVRVEKDADKARTERPALPMRFFEISGEGKVANESLEEVWQQPDKSAKPPRKRRVS